MTVAESTRWEYFEGPGRTRFAYVSEPAAISADLALPTGRSADRLRRILGYLAGSDTELVDLMLATESFPVKLSVPLVALGVFADVLDDLAEGRQITVAPYDTPLGAEEAARQLNVSRTWVTRLGDSGQVPCGRTGAKRRFRLGDVSSYRRRSIRMRQPPVDDWAFLDESVNADQEAAEEAPEPRKSAE